ncbi:BTB and MATH domain-containing protein 38-like isoform X2 [Haliotis rufescens]|uniref:BTB and MATH domain-containing protein 38-like isoform X2 n=1 Tax=Haliotis rufescens TaxID=6454 RepID=UPI00201F4EB4|nr:BTB and MATH domain-containing protein 38-like isoform X2 [Haliotis rufescens]
MENSENMFSEESLTSDVALVVEGQKLHVNKTVLSLASPVFENMFFGEFKEKTLLEVPLPGKTYDDMVELLLCIYPSTANPVTADNIDALLPLAEEYVMTSLKQRCRTFVTTYLKLNVKTLSKSQLVHFMHLADKYDFDDVLEDCLARAVYIEYSGTNGLQHKEEFQDLSDEAAVQFFKRRLVLVGGLVRPVLQIATNPSGELHDDLQAIIGDRCKSGGYFHRQHKCGECEAACCKECRKLGTKAINHLARVIPEMLSAFKKPK